ncbi:MAG: Tat pathway signal protein [Hungatella sp.]|nr:Tat pathway signal protein [Hungatella sp.]
MKARNVGKIKGLWSGVMMAAVVLGMTVCGGRTVYGAAAGAVQGAEGEAQAVIPTEKGTLSCTTDKTNVNITGSVSGAVSDPAVYDNYWYLFEMQPYEDDLGSRTDYAAWWTKGDTISCSLPLGFGTTADKLYSKFVLAVFDGTKYHAISEPTYITNPEVLAKNTAPYKNASSKKGLLLDGGMIADAMELGVKQTTINIAFHHILGEGIEYQYDGKTYHFNKGVVADYDRVVEYMSNKDLTVTAIILNGWNDNAPQLILPGVQKNAKANYYNFNASTPEGVETIKAVASFLAERYSGTQGRGKVTNWIIGNEINNNEIWNYAGEKDINTYVREYMKSFRVFYTAIKSVNSSDRLFFSTDFNWTDPEASMVKYGARDIIDTFGAMVKAGGDISWNLSYHPYPDPLTEPEFWDDAATGRAVDSVDTRVLNFSNLHILTDYMQRRELLAPDGSVRHIILSEQGFTSMSATRGDVEKIQAAAMAYAYYIADSNPYIDAIIMNRQVDSIEETNTSVALGLWSCDMSTPGMIKATKRKPVWTVFRVIDRKDSLEYTEFAKEIIGIEKWSDVIPDFKWKKYEK